MAKLVTPEMTRINKKNRKGSKKQRRSSLFKDSWKRFARNKSALLGLGIIVLLILVMIFANYIAPYSYSQQDYKALSLTPSLQHLFGTDKMGRDIFSRCVYATRVSLPIAIASVACSLLIGGSLGFISAYFGGAVDTVVMRMIDIMQSIPAMLLCIAIVAVMGNGIQWLILGMAISCSASNAKTCRAAILTVKTSEYVESSRAIGASNLRLLFKHMIPNAVGPIIIYLVSMLSTNVLMISNLSYIGVGISPPTPEWGSMLAYAKEFIQQSPYMVIFPGVCIMITCFGFNLMGDGLRDALDPRLK